MRCRDRGKDGIHPPMGGGWGTAAVRFAGVPGLTPLCRALLHISGHHHLLALSKSAVSRRLCQKGCRAGSMRLRHKTAARLCLMRDTQEMEASIVTSVSLFEQETGWS